MYNERVWAKAIHRVAADGISPEQATDEAIARVKQILSVAEARQRSGSGQARGVSWVAKPRSALGWHRLCSLGEGRPEFGTGGRSGTFRPPQAEERTCREQTR